MISLGGCCNIVDAMLEDLSKHECYHKIDLSDKRSIQQIESILSNSNKNKFFSSSSSDIFITYE